MTTEGAAGQLPIPRRHRDLLLAASVLTYLLVTLGGIVCVTDASRGCPDWPACYGQLVPPPRTDSIIEYSHRLLAGITSLTILAAAMAGWHRARSAPWVRWPPLIAIPFLLAVAAFGAMVVLYGLPPGLAALDLGSALIVLALMLVATTVAVHSHGRASPSGRLSLRSPYSRLAIAALIAVFLVLVSGVLVAASGSGVRCLGWPLYGGGADPVDLRGWLELARRWLSVPAGILILAVAVQAWREPKASGAIRRTAMWAGAFFAVEVAAGALLIVLGPVLALQLIHVAAAAALWSALVILVVRAGLDSSALAE